MKRPETKNGVTSYPGLSFCDWCGQKILAEGQTRTYYKDYDLHWWCANQFDLVIEIHRATEHLGSHFKER